MVKIAKKSYVWSGTAWEDLSSSVTDLSNYANLNTNQPTFRNVLINGGFGVDQRNNGATQTFTAAAALAYSVDRWYGYCTGANITGARVAGSAPAQYYYRFTGAASNTAVGFGQRIEAANSFHMAGKTVTLSVAVASTSLTSLTWTVYYANTTDTFGTLASPTRTQAATGTFTVSSTLGVKSATFTLPAAATTGVEIVFTGGALVGSQTLTFANAQLELGSIATPFEQRPIGTELALCQRYYCVVKGGQQVPGAWGIATGTNTLYTNARFPVTMRVTPSSTPYSYNSTANKISGVGSAADTGTTVTVNVNQIGPDGFITLNDSGTGFTTGSHYWFWYTANAEL